MVCALLALKSKESRSQEKIADVAGAEIGHHLRRMLQRREAEERRRRLAAERPFHRAESLLDFILALLLGQLLVDEGGVRPGVRADGVAGRHHLLEDFGIVGGVLADREEDAGGAFFRQRLQHRRRIHRPRTVVERQHHFLVAQEVELLEMLEAETGTAGRVDLDGAADAERVGIGAGRTGRGRRAPGRGQEPALPAARAAPLAGGVCDHAALDANSETAPAKINPAAIRILFSLNSNPAPGRGVAVVRSASSP